MVSVLVSRNIHYMKLGRNKRKRTLVDNVSVRLLLLLVSNEALANNGLPFLLRHCHPGASLLPVLRRAGVRLAAEGRKGDTVRPPMLRSALKE